MSGLVLIVVVAVGRRDRRGPAADPHGRPRQPVRRVARRRAARRSRHRERLGGPRGCAGARSPSRGPGAVGADRAASPWACSRRPAARRSWPCTPSVSSPGRGRRASSAAPRSPVAGSGTSRRPASAPSSSAGRRRSSRSWPCAQRWRPTTGALCRGATVRGDGRGRSVPRLVLRALARPRRRGPAGRLRRRPAPGGAPARGERRVRRRRHGPAPPLGTTGPRRACSSSLGWTLAGCLGVASRALHAVQGGCRRRRRPRRPDGRRRRRCGVVVAIVVAVAAAVVAGRSAAPPGRAAASRRSAVDLAAQPHAS